jgi:hypothetical protein
MEHTLKDFILPGHSFSLIISAILGWITFIIIYKIAKQNKEDINKGGGKILLVVLLGNLAGFILVAAGYFKSEELAFLFVIHFFSFYISLALANAYKSIKKN